MIINKDVDIIKYLGIPYVHEGVDWNGADCYGIIILFYKNEFDITVPHYKYNEDWELHDYKYIEQEYHKLWDKIEFPLKYCVATFKFLGRHTEHHMGIMLNDMEFLHIPLKQACVVDKLSNRLWKRSLSGFYRLKELYK